MSINIIFSMHAPRIRLGSKDWGWDSIQAKALELSEEMGYQCDIIEEYLIFQFCPEGYLWMKYEGRRVTGSSQTNVAGPGFHRAVIHFLELFAASIRLKLKLEDPTGYYRDRDFKHLQNQCFYRWFRLLMEEVLKQAEDGKEQLVCWPMNYYLPQEHPDSVVTHIRRFSIRELKQMVNSGITMAFAKDFFIWNEEEKDAYYFRNCGLALLHQECFFMPSERSKEDQSINQTILTLLEKSLEKDDAIRFPTELYLEICQLSKHQPIDLSNVYPMATEFPMGCRKELLYRNIGNIRFAVPGQYLHDTGAVRNSERYYDKLTENWHEFHICAINMKEKADFQKQTFDKDNIEEVIQFEAGHADGKIAIYRPKERDGDLVYTVSAQIIHDNQMTIVSVSYTDPAEKCWAVDLIKKIRTID